jgi:hypothetical protein
MAIDLPQSKSYEDPIYLVQQKILKLLSRPVVCANFQGLEANTFLQLAEWSRPVHVDARIVICNSSCTRAWLNYAPDYAVKSTASAKTHHSGGPPCKGGGGKIAYVVRPHAPDGAPTVGAARIGRGAVLERRATT